ncbi:unnamed protein product [Cyprideis torosa]|uniref:Uncharacterized protein n=1 Tax=Cyprideis torosa TaxID=163714 RepID=A0A7R8WA67_9CRUS|nr:unnamed protein product [Cyprideis torosa]CAG0890632.1 unnamed protein product [Cyprideis torosa]
MFGYTLRKDFYSYPMLWSFDKNTFPPSDTGPAALWPGQVARQCGRRIESDLPCVCAWEEAEFWCGCHPSPSLGVPGQAKERERGKRRREEKEEEEGGRPLVPIAPLSIAPSVPIAHPIAHSVLDSVPSPRVPVVTASSFLAATPEGLKTPEALENGFRVGRRLSLTPEEEGEVRKKGAMRDTVIEKASDALVCSRDAVKRKLPILDWAPKYQKDFIVPDLIAGISVGLTVIPHAIAFANLARLPVEIIPPVHSLLESENPDSDVITFRVAASGIGLYSSFVGCFVYLFLGSVSQVTIGPTATAALMTASFVAIQGYPPEYAISLCFISGCVTLLAGILNLGTFLDIWAKLFQNIGNTGLYEPILGICCIIFLVSLRYLKTYEWGEKDPALQSPKEKTLKTTIWFCCTASNALVVIISVIIASIIEKTGGGQPFPLTGEVNTRLPSIALPPMFRGIERTVGNETVVDGVGEVVSNLGSGFIVIPILAVLEQISIAKAFDWDLNFNLMINCLSAANGRAIDSNQEMISIGMSNILGSFVGSMPVTGAFARVAINAASGVKTQAGGVVTGFIVLLAISFLGPILYYIPIPTLGAVVICAVIFVVDFSEILRLWRTKSELDLDLHYSTHLQNGILLGVVISIIVILQDVASPKITSYFTQVNGEEVLVIRPDRSLFYPGMERVKQKINDVALENHSKSCNQVVIIDCSNVSNADSTTCKVNGEEVLVIRPDRSLFYPGMERVKQKINDVALENHSKSCNQVVIIDCSNVSNADSTTCKVLATLLRDFERRSQSIMFMGLAPKALKVLEGMMDPSFRHVKSAMELENCEKTPMFDAGQSTHM